MISRWWRADPPKAAPLSPLPTSGDSHGCVRIDPFTPPAGGRLGRLWAQARWDERVEVAVALLALADLVRLTRAGFGWDTQVYCAAAAAFGQGLDPYHVENLAGLSLSFVYQPIYLTLIAPLCGVAVPVPHPYTLASLVAVVLSVVLWPGALSRDGGVPAAVLALGGVSGLAWTVLTGNTSAFEMLVLTLAVAVALPALTGLTGGFPLGKTSVWWNFQQPLSLLLVLILLLLAHSPFGERLRLRGV